MQGFIIFDDYAHRYNELQLQMTDGCLREKCALPRHLIEGLDEARSIQADSV
ncbi:hypothetical protein OK016_23695 [Vibrio chagasii]|nr:hypothetical protein [Vibrio chagasii]